MRTILCTALTTLALLAATAAYANDNTPVGAWTQVDDATGKAKSIVDITQLPNGTLQAVVKQVLFSDQGTHPICKKCSGARHNQPVDGMIVMWGVKQDGNAWDGGKILDPASGKIYKVKLTLEDGGQKLNVRGYIGMPMLGRTQTWQRRAAGN